MLRIHYFTYSQESPIVQSTPQNRSYEERNVRRRENRAKAKYKNLLEKHKELRARHIESLKEIEKLKNINKNITQELIVQRSITRAKMQLNRQNLRRRGNLSAYYKKKTAIFSKRENSASDKLKENMKTKSRQVQELKTELETVDQLCSELQEENEQKKKEMDTLRSSKCPATIETKNGNRYSNDIRELYYSLLAQQMPPAKIELAIKTILKLFNPSRDLTQLHLPKSSLAAKMRSQELPTISKAHQAHLLAETSTYHLNSDGTTLNQKKVEGMLVNGIVLGVNDVVDGSAKSAVEELEVVLSNIRDTAQVLEVPGAQSIGWSLVQSSMSDQASTQKLFNKLVEEKVQEERVQLGENTQDEGKQVLELFCGMHLGVNLRTAQIKGLMDHLNGASSGVDTVVHSTCKLLGHLGTNPEYGRGVQGFPEYIKSLIDESRAIGNSESEEVLSLKSALGVRMERQVGSRYFVTARNAGRVFYLRPLAIRYLEETSQTKELNGLEKDVLRYMKSDTESALLKVDGLFFDKIYADLMILMKSKKLGKKLLDVNPHYHELLQYLELISERPRLILDPDHKVFVSEPKIYTCDDKCTLNHRLHKNYQPVRTRIYETDSFDDSLVLPMVATAAVEMANKVRKYKADQLPGGKLWEPSTEIKEKLKDIDPTNDLCESVLGLNDWLQKRNPNYAQRTVSTMVEVLRNATMPWFVKQERDTKDKIIHLARIRANKVLTDDRERAEQRRLERKRKHKIDLEKAGEKKARVEKEQERLAAIPQITNIEDLEEALTKIQCSTQKKTEEAEIRYLRDQLQLLHPGKRIYITEKGKKKSVLELKQQLTDAIDSRRRKSSLRVDMKVQHKLKDSDTDLAVWYDGIITSKSEESINIRYTGYDDDFEWSVHELQEDIDNGDFKFI